MLKVTSLNYQVQGKTLLNDITFELFDGELLVVLGPNGAGKSTLLKCCTGAVTATYGGIQFNHHPLERWPLKDLAQVRAVMTQHVSIPFALTVSEVVALGLSPWSVTAKKAQRTIADTLEMVGLSRFSGRVFNTLSGGEQQRVQLARVLAQLLCDNPDTLSGKLLFLDEPISALDLQQQQNVLRLVKSLSQRGLAVFCVLHDINLAALYADRLLILDQGETRFIGPPKSLATTRVIDQTYHADMIQIDHCEQSLPQWQFRC